MNHCIAGILHKNIYRQREGLAKMLDYQSIKKQQRESCLIKAIFERIDKKATRFNSFTWEQLESVARHQWSNQSAYLSPPNQNFPLLDRYMSIEMHNSLMRFGEAVKLTQRCITYFPSGKRFVNAQFGNWIIGDGCFGYSRSSKECSDDRFILRASSSESEPNFSIGSNQIVAIHRHVYDSVESPAVKADYWSLHLYQGRADSLIDPSLESIRYYLHRTLER